MSDASCRRCYSYRRQTIGSCFAACCAGTMPNTSPTATDTPNATTTDIGDTIVWILRDALDRRRSAIAADDDAGDAAGEADHHRLAEELRAARPAASHRPRGARRSP